MWKPTVESSSALIRLSCSFAPFSVCILSLFITAVHSIWLSRKYHPFTRSACPWYLPDLFSNGTVTVLEKLNLVLHFAAELLMLMVRCNYYLSDFICWMTLTGFKNDASQICPFHKMLGASAGSYDRRKGRSRNSTWGALGLEPMTLNEFLLPSSK